MDILSFILLLTGGLFVLLGFLSGRFPPKQINWWYGYRTKRSMRNQDTWGFANRFAAQVMMLAGAAMALLGALLLLVGYRLHPLLFLLPIWVAVIFIFIRVERRLKDEFDDEGKRRSGPQI